MKKLLPIISLIFVLVATPAIASQGKDKRSDNNSSQETSCEGEFENHGAFVSCVAHQHPGGQVVSQAAHSDIGKKDHDQDEDELASPSPTVSPTPSASPEASPTPSVSPSPNPSPEIQISERAGNTLQKLIKRLQDLITRLEHLIQ